jgi:anti-sigma factor RsiW
LTTPVQHCKECVDLLGDYIDGALPPERAQALEEHLSLCPPCITFVRTYKATGRLCRHVLQSEMPRELIASLKSFLGEHVPGFACTKPDIAPAGASAAADGARKKV